MVQTTLKKTRTNRIVDKSHKTQHLWMDLRKGVTLRKTPNFGTFQAITISKQWGPLTLFLV